MANIYVTGDKHRDFDSIVKFCNEVPTTKDDLMIILGDNGVNYYGDDRGDLRIKKRLQNLPITFMMIRGNHDKRPSESMGYREQLISTYNYDGYFLVQDAFPSLLFARDGAFYHLKQKNVFVAGGAYSVDKYYRLERGWHWFPDEQMTPDEMSQADRLLRFAADQNIHIDAIMTHTCPYKYRPVDLFLPGLDQSTVDDSMEQWLDTVESRFLYDRWYCGHWHTDRSVDKLRFLYQDFILFE